MSEEANRPLETSPFTIGGKEIQVPVMSFWDLERLREKIDSIRAGMDWIDYSRTILRTVAQLISPEEENESQETFVRLQKSCSIPEMRLLGESFNELLTKSGFLSGEAPTATENPGTGTSTALSPNSPLGESAAEIQSESSVH